MIAVRTSHPTTFIVFRQHLIAQAQDNPFRIWTQQSGVGFLQAFLFLADDHHFGTPHTNVSLLLKSAKYPDIDSQLGLYQNKQAYRYNFQSIYVIH
jgi:hypothetical protein